jgi:hypothetical protein
VFIVRSEGYPMSSRELSPEWVLSAFLSNTRRPGQDHVSELAIVARRLWPRVQSHARKELADEGFDDAIVFGHRRLGGTTAICRENHAALRGQEAAASEP